MTQKVKRADELRAEIEASSSEARGIVAGIFDEGTFLEIGTYVQKKDAVNDFESVITGCGAVDGRLVFMFIQDFQNRRGAITSSHSKKICALYDMAIKAKAPVVGVFSSAGSELSEGIDAISAYGAIMSRAVKAKNLIPQIALITGICGGAEAVVAKMFDFTVAEKNKAKMYVIPPDADSKDGISADIITDGMSELTTAVRELLSYIPSNSTEGTVYAVSGDDINTPSDGIEALVSSGNYDMRELIATLSDNGEFFELSSNTAPEIICGFAQINGRVVGINANQPAENGGALTGRAARKAAGFINFLGRFSIPLLTLTDTEGFGGKVCGGYPKALSELAEAYVSCTSAKITAVVGKAYGSAFIFMGSKSLGADIVFALDGAVISVMKPETAVEFIWDDRLKAADNPAASRITLTEEWKTTEASPLSAARSGDIDDIVAYSELRRRIAAAFEVFSFKAD